MIISNSTFLLLTKWWVTVYFLYFYPALAMQYNFPLLILIIWRHSLQCFQDQLSTLLPPHQGHSVLKSFHLEQGRCHPSQNLPPVIRTFVSSKIHRFEVLVSVVIVVGWGALVGYWGMRTESSWVRLESTFAGETFFLLEAGENLRWLPMNLEESSIDQEVGLLEPLLLFATWSWTSQHSAKCI